MFAGRIYAPEIGSGDASQVTYNPMYTKYGQIHAKSVSTLENPRKGGGRGVGRMGRFTNSLLRNIPICACLGGRGGECV